MWTGEEIQLIVEPAGDYLLHGLSPPRMTPAHVGPQVARQGLVWAAATEQEHITPYTPEPNGLLERILRTFQDECIWQHRFESFEEARQVIRKWIEWYNQSRPHHALGYLSPTQYCSQQLKSVA